ncbi:MAG: single-stranded-DNA-specific exonuclease RecJ, partial [Acidobacteriota bacterium]
MSDVTDSEPIWTPAPIPAAASVLTEAGYLPWMSSSLARRGVESAAQAESFLAPSISDLTEPQQLDNLSRAVERLCRARSADEKVAIVGDYDVDGISATAILLAVFRRCGIEAAAILPNRFETGYGFQPAHVEDAADQGCGLIVTADCGSSATAALAAARELDLDVIVTDHHLSSDRLPEWVIEINPKQQEEGDACRDLAGSGVALKLAVALLRELEIPVRFDSLLRIACLGTICDLVPLQGENRVIVSLGLKALAETRSRGLRALIDRAGVRPPFRAPDIGFRIGPRINAAGRLADPAPALELLMTRDQAVANSISARLEELNRQRQVEESHVVEEAVDRFADVSELPPILVAWDESWHRGVVGIAAGHLSRKFHRPAILMAIEDGLATGSGRSIPGIHLHAFLEEWAEELVRFGGHAQAIGLTLAE